MAERITHQRELDERRNSIDFCYLCGQRLHGGAPNIGQVEFDDDHVPPKGILGPAPSQDSWVPMLRVHRSCHVRKNLKSEEATILVNKLMVSQGQALPPQIRSVKFRPHDFTGMGFKSAEITMGMNIDAPLHIAAHNWARGMHSFLYRCFQPSPAGNIPCASMSPFPESVRGFSVEQVERFKDMLNGILRHALESDCWDGVTAWNGTVRYVCTWSRSFKDRRLSQCIWGLLHPGTEMYSKGTPWPRDRGWMGRYLRVGAPPENASVLPHSIPDILANQDR